MGVSGMVETISGLFISESEIMYIIENKAHLFNGAVVVLKSILTN